MECPKLRQRQEIIDLLHEVKRELVGYPKHRQKVVILSHIVALIKNDTGCPMASAWDRLRAEWQDVMNSCAEHARKDSPTARDSLLQFWALKPLLDDMDRLDPRKSTTKGPDFGQEY